nr:MAG TPA: hypothetical protein [Caudoviricetes sp.]
MKHRASRDGKSGVIAIQKTIYCIVNKISTIYSVL